MTVFKRTLLACSAIALCGLFQTGFIVIGTNSLSTAIEKASTQPVRHMDAAYSAWDGFRNAEILLGEVLDSISFRDARESTSRFNDLMKAVEAHLSELDATVSSTKSHSDLSIARQSILEWKGNALVLLGVEPATGIIAPHAMARSTARVRQNLLELVNDAKAEAQAARSAIAEQTSSFNLMTVLVGLAGLMLGLGLAYLLARALTRPLSSLEQRMHAIAAGDLAGEIEHRDRKDEIGSMAKALSLFREHAIETDQLRQERSRDAADRAAEKAREMEELAHTFEQSVAAVVEAVSEAARSIRTNSTTLATSTAETDSEATQVATISHETSNNVRSAATAAEQLSATVVDIAARTEKARIMSGTAAESAHQSAQIVSNLSQSVSQIGEVVKIINSIAEQTNLLALNATIEAARAGASGRGFAVVASEVKTLAGQTSKATQQIAAQIEAVQLATSEAVGTIKEISIAIPQINEISNAIAIAMQEQQMAAREIAHNVEQAASHADRVSTRMTFVSNAAREAGQNSQTMLSASDDLIHRSDSLVKEVKIFVNRVRAA